MAILATERTFELEPDGSGIVWETETREGPFSFSEPIVERRQLVVLTVEEVAEIWAAKPGSSDPAAEADRQKTLDAVTADLATAQAEIVRLQAVETAKGALDRQVAEMNDQVVLLETENTQLRADVARLSAPPAPPATQEQT